MFIIMTYYPGQQAILLEEKRKNKLGFFGIIYTVPAKSHMLCLSLMPADWIHWCHTSRTISISHAWLTNPYELFFEDCVAKWLTPWTLDLEIQASNLSLCIVSLDKELCSTLSLFTHVYKWVPATYFWGITLPWTSIPSRGSSNSPWHASC